MGYFITRNSFVAEVTFKELKIEINVRLRGFDCLEHDPNSACSLPAILQYKEKCFPNLKHCI